MAPFFEPVACAELRAKRVERGVDLLRSGRDRLDLTRRQATILARRGRAHELADLLRVLERDRLGRARRTRPPPAFRVSSSVRQRLLLAPVVETAHPEVVVLVEVALLARAEELAPAGEPVLERDELLVAVEVDLLRLPADLVLEVGEVGGALLGVDRGDDRSGEVEHLLELARRDVEQVADPARDALEEPDVRDGGGEIDVPHALAPDLLARHLDAAALADDALVADALVLAAVALPVLGGTEDALAEEAVPLGLEGSVVDGLRLRYLAGRPVADLLARGESDPDRVEVVDVDHVLLRLISSQCCRGVVAWSSEG